MGDPPTIEDVQRRLREFRRTRHPALAAAENRGDPVVDVAGKEEQK